MRAYGRRKVLALAAGVLAAATACSGDAQPQPSKAAATSSASASPSAPPPAVTLDEAAEVFSTVTVTSDTLRAESDLHGRLELALNLTTGGQTPLTVAAYLAHDYAPPRYRWGPPTLFVPRFGQGERSPWFSALATRDGTPTLVTFAKGDRWRISSASRLVPGEKLPEIQLDADGYATAVAPDDKSVTISPQFMGPVHASVAETGSSGVTGGLVAAGPHTTEVAEQIADLREQAKSDGFSYDSIFSADNYPVYALRTEDGGALIQYSLTRTTTTTTKTAEDDYIPVPESARWAISSQVLRRTMKLTETHQYATVVPSLKSPAPAAVIAYDGALTRASGQ
ncbi:hypothetical protein [Nonomuraea phyllanthi]|uniref:hypothetical protein n=1 Tax=Nonomuraea phyllanthi TaxID=2219224 RepID=UPI001293907B|nr:hypothetical protein [Nonomuraea phyllanthi]